MKIFDYERWSWGLLLGICLEYLYRVKFSIYPFLGCILISFMILLDIYDFFNSKRKKRIKFTHYIEAFRRPNETEVKNDYVREKKYLKNALKGAVLHGETTIALFKIRYKHGTNP